MKKAILLVILFRGLCLRDLLASVARVFTGVLQNAATQTSVSLLSADSEPHRVGFGLG